MNDRHSPSPAPDQRQCRPQMMVLPTVLLGGNHIGMQPSARGGQRWQPHALRALCDELPSAPMGWDYPLNFSAFNGKAAILVFNPFRLSPPIGPKMPNQNSPP